MVLSLFKPKPMISVVLTKEKIKSTNADTGLSCVENRLDLIDCKLRKLKKRSEKVFECNNLDTLSQVQACNEELRKKECQAKKKVRICAPGDKQTCDLSPDDSTSDINCNDFDLSDSDNGSAEECEAEENDCQDEEEATPEEDTCPEEKSCEISEPSETDECDAKDECGEDTKDKKCQVMTAEVGASTYLLSQLQVAEDGVIEAHIPNIISSTGSNEKTGSIGERKSGTKILPNCSLVIPIITTTSAHSLSRTSTRDLRVANNCTLVVGDQGSGQPLLSNFEVQKQSTEDDKYDKNISLSQVTIDSESCVKQESSVPSTKKINSTSGSQINPNSNQSLKENINRSGTNRSLLKDQFNSADLVVDTDNKQPSIIYIVQSPSQRSGPKLPCDTAIRIEASKVYIQNTASQVEAFTKYNSAEQKNVIDHMMSDVESETSDISPSVKFESRVSFQQPDSISDKEVKQISSATKTQEEVVANTSRVSFSPIHNSSSRLLSKSTGSKTSNKEDSQTQYFPEGVNTRSDRINLDVSKEDNIYIMQKVQDSHLSNIACYEDHLMSKENFQSNAGSAISDCSKKQWEKDSLNKSTCTSEYGGRSIPNSFVSDCDAFNKSQVPFMSDCDAMRLSQGHNISDCDAKRLSQVQYASDCENILTKNGSIQISAAMSQVSNEIPVKLDDTNLHGLNSEISEGEFQTHISLHSSNNVPSAKNLTHSISKATSNSKSSFNTLTNARSTNENLNLPVQMTSVSNNRVSNVRVENDESVHSGRMINLNNKTNTTGSNNNSWQTLLNQEISEVSQKNEMITMYANMNLQEQSMNNQSKDFLVIHCDKCKELCIAKIVKKVQPDSGIWSGQRHKGN